MLRRLFIFFPLLFVLFTTRASVEGIVLSSESNHEYSFHEQKNVDGFHSSVVTLEEVVNFFESEEEDDDEHIYCLFKYQRISDFHLLATKSDLSATRQWSNSRLRLYLLFHSWKIDLLK